MKNSIVIFFLMLGALCNGQETETEKEYKKYRIGISSVNSHIPAIEDINDREVIPAWGVEFEYRLSERWAFGIMTEVELQSYVVSHEGQTFLEREYPFTSALVGIFELTDRISINAGIGIELEKNENFELLTFGAGYKIPLMNDWDFTPGVAYNSRFNAFDTWSLNLTFGKSF